MSKIEIIKENRPLLSLLKYPMLLLAFVFISSASNFVNAQVFADLDYNTQNAVIEAFEEEMEGLRLEVLNPQSGISTESNKNVYYYYQGVVTNFQNEDLTLKEAFIRELNKLLYGPVGSHQLTQTLFYRSIAEAPPIDRSELGFQNEGNISAGNYNAQATQASTMLFFQTRENFRNILKDIAISNNDLSNLEELFSFIKSNK